MQRRKKIDWKLELDLGFVIKIILVGILFYFLITAFSSESTINIESEECKTFSCDEILWGMFGGCHSKINERCLELKYSNNQERG